MGRWLLLLLQVPQFLLDSYLSEGRGADINIICTREIAKQHVAGGRGPWD